MATRAVEAAAAVPTRVLPAPAKARAPAPYPVTTPVAAGPTPSLTKSDVMPESTNSRHAATIRIVSSESGPAMVGLKCLGVVEQLARTTVDATVTRKAILRNSIRSAPTARPTSSVFSVTVLNPVTPASMWSCSPLEVESTQPPADQAKASAQPAILRASFTRKLTGDGPFREYPPEVVSGPGQALAHFLTALPSANEFCL